MGRSHALAYKKLDNFKISALVSRGESKNQLQKELGLSIPLYDSFEKALAETKPDAVCISTYPDTHEEYALKALETGCHVFIEKPLANTVEGCIRISEMAKKQKRKLVIGYILRHHPSWSQFIELSKGLGKPLVMRMNLNQQSHGKMWTVHKNLMNSLSPIVDCGVHYVDIMCQMTRSKPIRVNAIGARLSDEIAEDNYNYGQLQVTFEDGSVGWYEAGWGPMASTKAFFIKDVWGPSGSVTITADKASDENNSDDVDSHTRTEKIRVHNSKLDSNNEFVVEDEWIDTGDEPDHNELCLREQDYFARAIIEDIDLEQHWDDAISSLKIVLAADRSIKMGRTVEL